MPDAVNPLLAAVAAPPGTMFGPAQEPYLRFAFANLDSAYMPELAARLAASQG